MVKGHMETKKRQLAEMKEEVKIIQKFFDADQSKKPVVPPLPNEITFGKP
jgi:hypothetical protein